MKVNHIRGHDLKFTEITIEQWMSFKNWQTFINKSQAIIYIYIYIYIYRGLFYDTIYIP